MSAGEEATETLEDLGFLVCEEGENYRWTDKRQSATPALKEIEFLQTRINGLNWKNTELQSTITAQEETIKRLREAGENIRQEAVTQEPFSEPEGYSYITAWDDLMNELGEK